MPRRDPGWYWVRLKPMPEYVRPVAARLKADGRWLFEGQELRENPDVLHDRREVYVAEVLCSIPGPDELADLEEAADAGLALAACYEPLSEGAVRFTLRKGFHLEANKLIDRLQRVQGGGEVLPDRLRQLAAAVQSEEAADAMLEAAAELEVPCIDTISLRRVGDVLVVEVTDERLGMVEVIRTKDHGPVQGSLVSEGVHRPFWERAFRDKLERGEEISNVNDVDLPEIQPHDVVFGGGDYDL